MGGILIHTIFGLLSSVIVYHFFKKFQYSAAIFIGNFLQDVFIIAYAPFFLKTLDPMKIITSSYFLHRHHIFNVLWMIFQTIFVVTFLFFQKKVRKKEFRDFEYNLGFLLLGIITHAVLDLMIHETGIWI